jgi:uncharacterized protein (TIGR03067 family)
LTIAGAAMGFPKGISMIRSALLFGMILTTTSLAADDKKEVPKDLAPFQGSWKVVKVEPEPTGGLPEEVRFSFAGNKLTIKEGKGMPQTGSITVDPKKDPNEIDLVGGPKNEKSLGIYKFEKDGNKLTVTFVRKPDAPRPKKFGEPDAVLIVLEKEKEK